MTEESEVYSESERVETTVETTYRPRGKWELTDSQRIIVGVLLWLNILVLVLVVLVLTGQLAI
ncbi:hypothetical protein [Promineifilum sp.]|uniref:hypothetical protein n=1 Tax=Promineifilum sp. TaxID=2664178 RepID=UPI0035B41D0F